MLKAPIPFNEEERLKTLREYEVLDTLQEDHFDEITKTASLICGCKISLITLIDKNRQWFKSKHGLEVSETPRDISYCGHAIMHDELLVIEDAKEDERFCDNPLLLSEPHVRFYAGAPLIAPNGQRIGTLCVIDSEPKSLNESQRLLLKTLSKQVINYIELRRRTDTLDSCQEKRTKILNNMLEGMVVLNSTGKITEFNPAALEILDLTEEQIVERNTIDPRWKPIRTDGSQFPTDEHPAMITLRTGETVKNVVMGLGYPRDGLKWIRINSTPLETPNGINAVTTFQDITELINKNSELESYEKGLDTHAIVARTDKKGKISYVNQTFCEVSGYSEDELIGQDHRILNSGYHDKSFFKKMWKTISSGKVWRGEILNVSKSGQLYWVDTTITPLIDQNGEIKEYIALRYETTKKKLAEIDLKNSENKLRQLFEQSRDAVMTLEPPNWNFSSCNHATLELFNISSEDEFKKMGPWNVAPKKQPDGEDSSAKAKKMITNAMENGAQFFEWMHTTIDGREIPCTVMLSRISDGEEAYLHAVVRDVSEQKTLEKKLLESNQQLDLALEGAGLGVWDWDLTNNSVEFDKRWAEMIGLDSKNQKMQHSTWKSRVHPDDVKDCQKDMKAYMDGKTDRYENVHRMKHENGSWVYILDRGRFSDWDKDGNPIRFTGTHLDITETKRNHDQKLAEINEILSSTPSCLKIINNEGLIIDMNTQGLSLIDAESLNTVLKTNFYDIVTDEHRERFKEFNKRICLGHKESLVFEIIGLKGTRRWLDSHAAPYKLPNGEIAHIAITNDITERVLAEEEYEKQKAVAQHHAKLASIGELAAGVGHEINNPLAIVKGYLSTLERKVNSKSSEPKDLQKYFYKINVATDRIGKIVQGLRTFSRSDSVESSEFSPIEAVEESFNMVSEIYESDDIHIKLKNNTTRNILTKGNRGKFQQVIMNLVSNAKDAVSQNDDRQIEINLSEDHEKVIISVVDNGHGIPENIQDKVFDPFFTTKDVNKGTGIGLSLVHNFIKEMDGKLHIGSEENIGTTFTVEIPTTVPSEETPQIKNEKQERTHYKATALLVDDEEDIRELMSEILEDIGLEVTPAENGQEAFELYSSRPSEFDLVISDIKMPKMDGITLLKKIRSIKNLDQPKFIFITGGINTDFEDKGSKLNHLIDGYLFKPFEEEKIHEIISKCLKSKQNKAA